MGRTEEKIRMRLGASQLGQKDATVYSGCFTVACHPIVMTQNLVDMIGHDVMLGQGYMRLCLGMLDPFTKDSTSLQHGQSMGVKSSGSVYLV